MSDTQFALRVDEDLRAYLKEVTEQLKQTASEGAEDVDVLVSNVLEEVEGKELKVATDVECSRALERILRAASSDQVLGIAERIAQRDTLYTIACNPFGSHVLETLLERVNEFVDDSITEKCRSVITEFIFLVKEDLADYIDHKYGTFFARKLLQLLSRTFVAKSSSADGAEAPSKQQGHGLSAKIDLIQQKSGTTVLATAAKRSRADQHASPVPEEFQSHIRTFVNVLCGAAYDADALVSLQRSTYASPFLQSLMTCAAADRDASEALCLRLLGIEPQAAESASVAMKRLDGAKLIANMKNKASSHSVEALLQACPETLFEGVWTALKPQAASLCLNPIANFAMQALVAAIPAARYVTDMFQAVKASLHDIVLNRRSGVAVALLAACAAWRASCDDMCQAITSIFEDDQAVSGLATLDTGMDLAVVAASEARRPPRLSVNGCLMLQAMLAMPQTACKDITDALVALPDEQLRAIAADSSGVHVLEAFLKGSAPKPLKRKLAPKLKDSFAHLAPLPAPSRFVESLFIWADIDDKTLIAEALGPSYETLKSGKYSASLCQVCALEAWQRSPEEWKRRIQNSEKLNAQFQKLFGASTTKQSAKERRKRKKKEKAEAGADGAATENDDAQSGGADLNVGKGASKKRKHSGLDEPGSQARRTKAKRHAHSASDEKPKGSSAADVHKEVVEALQIGVKPGKSERSKSTDASSKKAKRKKKVETGVA